MNNDPLRENLRRLASKGAVYEADRVLRHSCIGRIVSMLTFLFIVICIVVYGLLVYGLYRIGLAERLGSMLSVGFFVGLILAVVAAGLVGNWLRNRIWRFLLRRMR
ncbi:MAG TPA: hypothetical protein ENK08_01425 [Chloroflexi bacterium]|nr:hypothetical protein [Chloroflexota bacterium]